MIVGKRSGFLDIQRQNAARQAVDERLKHYGEIYRHLTAEQIQALAAARDKAEDTAIKKVLADAEKEFDAIASTGFGQDGTREQRALDFSSVRGTFAGNSFVKSMQNLPYAQAHAWNARWEDGVVHLSPLAAECRREMKGVIITPAGPLTVTLSRSETSPSSWRISEQSGLPGVRLRMANACATVPASDRPMT